MREINGFTAEFRQEINVRLFFCTLMTNNRGLVSPGMIGIMLVAASLLLVTTGSQFVTASNQGSNNIGMGNTGTGNVGDDGAADLDLEEAALAENATIAATNETADGNMTGINSTS